MTCTGWNEEPSVRWMKEKPALESRRVRTQPFSVTGVSRGARPASTPAQETAATEVIMAMI